MTQLPLWFPLLALVLLCIVFLKRRLYQQFPLFFLYALYAVLVGAARYLAFYTSHNLYFYTYWISELGGAITTSLALYELLLRRLFSGFSKIRLYRNLFPLAAFLILILTIATALAAPDRRAAFLMASRAYDFLRTAVLVFFIALMAFMGRNWTRYDFGITLGFGVQAIAALTNAAFRTRVFYKPTVLGIIQVISYDLSCLIWLITFFKPEKVETLPSEKDLSPETLHEARKWESSLKDWLTPGKK